MCTRRRADEVAPPAEAPGRQRCCSPRPPTCGRGPCRHWTSPRQPREERLQQERSSPRARPSHQSTPTTRTGGGSCVQLGYLPDELGRSVPCGHRVRDGSPARPGVIRERHAGGQEGGRSMTHKVAARFEIFKDDAGGFHWRLVAATGETVAQSDRYLLKAS